MTCICDIDREPVRRAVPSDIFGRRYRAAWLARPVEWFAPAERVAGALAHATRHHDRGAIFGGAVSLCGRLLVVGDSWREHPVTVGPDVTRCPECLRTLTT